MSAHPRSRRILIVEDNPVDRFVLRQVVARAGDRSWEWREAASGREAIEALEEQLPDCVLLDYCLPDVEDLELLREIVRRGGDEVAVVMLTAKEDETIASAAIREGAQDFLVKDGVSRTRLVTSIEAAVERKRMDADLHRREREFHRVLDSLTAVLVAIDHEDLVTTWNRRAAEILGVPLEEAVGRRLFDLGLRCDAHRLLQAVKRCRESRESQSVAAVPFSREDVGSGLLDVDISLADMDGEPGVLLLATDVTEIEALHRQLVQAQKLEAIGQLAAGIAHEINTPTQFVSDNTTFLKESFTTIVELLASCDRLARAEGDFARHAGDVAELARSAKIPFLLEEVPSALEESMAGLTRVSRIVRAMKAFSHPGTEEKARVDLNAAIENTTIVARNEWKYVADLETDFDPELPNVPCLVGELNQVVLNMIVNAAHSIADVVERSKGEKGLIRISSRCDEGHVEVSISDTGAGIPEEIRSRIFDPFFTTKEVGKGTGQGLAIAHDVVVGKHGGSIRVESEVGRGTTFVVRLPLEVERAEAA